MDNFTSGQNGLFIFQQVHFNGIFRVKYLQVGGSPVTSTFIFTFTVGHTVICPLPVPIFFFYFYKSFLKLYFLVKLFPDEQFPSILSRLQFPNESHGLQFFPRKVFMNRRILSIKNNELCFDDLVYCKFQEKNNSLGNLTLYWIEFPSSVFRPLHLFSPSLVSSPFHSLDMEPDFTLFDTSIVFFDSPHPQS